MSDTMYTQGNWEVTRQTKDTERTSGTANTPVKIEVPALQYNPDFILREDEPNEVIVYNQTADGIDAKESIRYGYTNVPDVYKRFPELKIPAAERAAANTGVQTLVEVKHLYHATNKVSGEEITLPASVRMVMVLPSHCAVTNAMLTDIVSRGIAAMYQCQTGGQVTNPNRIIDCTKGSLKPNLG